MALLREIETWERDGEEIIDREKGEEEREAPRADHRDVVLWKENSE